MASILDSANQPVGNADAAYEEVRPAVADPDEEHVTYGLDRHVTTGAYFLRVTRSRKDKDDSVKRIAVRPFARAMALSVID